MRIHLLKVSGIKRYWPGQVTGHWGSGSDPQQMTALLVPQRKTYVVGLVSFNYGSYFMRKLSFVTSRRCCVARVGSWLKELC